MSSISIRRGNRTSLLWAAGVALGSAIIVLAVFLALEAGWLGTGALQTYVSLSMALVIIASVGLWSGRAEGPGGRFDPFELPVWYTLLTLFSLVFFGFLAFSDDSRYWLPALVSSDWIPDGLWLLVLGLAGLWVGYRLLWLLFPIGAATAFPRVLRDPSSTLVWGWYAFTIIERLWRIRVVGTAFGADVSSLGDASVFNQWSIYVEESVRLVVAIVALQVFWKRWRPHVLAWVLGIEMLFIFLGGFIKPLLWLGIVVVAAIRYSGFSLRARPWGLVALGVLGAVLIPVIERYRVLIATGSIDMRSVLSMLGGLVAALDAAWGHGPGGAWDIFSEKVGIRQAHVMQILAVLVRLTPDVIPHWGADRLLAIPFYLVPRAFWPDKPSLSQGVHVSVAYLEAPTDTNTSSAVTIFGDLYLAAGWMAVFVGMLVLGLVCALLYRFLKINAERNGRPELIALWIALAVSMADIESSYVGLMTGLIQRLAFFGALFWILHPPPSWRRASAALPGHAMPGLDLPAARR